MQKMKLDLAVHLAPIDMRLPKRWYWYAMNSSQTGICFNKTGWSHDFVRGKEERIGDKVAQNHYKAFQMDFRRGLMA